MRFSQANWISIDAAERTLACQHCSAIMSLAHEPLNTFGFVRAIARLARGHFSCPSRNRAELRVIEARREETIAQEMAAVVTPFSGVTTEDNPLCLVCEERRTYSKHQVCGVCQNRHGLPQCNRIIRRKRAEQMIAGEEELGSATLRGVAAGAGEVN